ncbi:MAG: hypothetical protein QOC63_1033 [Mycobacterium sp.]|jgi:hypothetical protein|nr:hypothetical protein [Mycobacterium sp.]
MSGFTGPVRVTLMAGPMIPVPVGSDILSALDSITVESASGQTQSGFELTFNLDRGSPLNTLFLLSGGTTVPILRVIIALTVGGATTVLVDGVMTHHELRTPGPGRTQLVVKGKDLTALMDIIPFTGLPFPAMPEFARAALILAKYSVLGCTPLTIPSFVTDLPLPIDRIPTQQGTDYAYLTQLASDVGWTFYLDPGPTPGNSVAYWGPEVRIGSPQPALNADLDAPDNNVSDLNFNFDKEAYELPLVYVQLPVVNTPIPIPIPPITPMSPPLGLVPPVPPKTAELKYTAKLNPVTALMAGMAYAAQHSDAVTATGKLNVARYGQLLSSRRLVGVRGAGAPFDGLHYVKQVTTTIKRGDIAQSFSLARAGLLSTVPTVPA